MLNISLIFWLFAWLRVDKFSSTEIVLAFIWQMHILWCHERYLSFPFLLFPLRWLLLSFVSFNGTRFHRHPTLPFRQCCNRASCRANIFFCREKKNHCIFQWQKLNHKKCTKSKILFCWREMEKKSTHRMMERDNVAAEPLVAMLRRAKMQFQREPRDATKTIVHVI